MSIAEQSFFLTNKGSKATCEIAGSVVEPDLFGENLDFKSKQSKKRGFSIYQFGFINLFVSFLITLRLIKPYLYTEKLYWGRSKKLCLREREGLYAQRQEKK